MTDELTITGEVGERWTLTRHAIDRALHELDPDVEYRLGGGTVLAAQWKHRKSYDIDLQVSPVELQRLETSEFDWLKQAVKDWGATTKLYDRAALYEIAFGDGLRHSRPTGAVSTTRCRRGKWPAVKKADEARPSAGTGAGRPCTRLRSRIGNRLACIIQCAVTKAPFPSGCESRPATVAPAGSSRSG